MHTLDFMGRRAVSAPSNMQLTRWLPGGFIEAGSGAVMFQFVQIGRDSFALDFCGPLSPLAAFAIALSSLDDKLIYSLG